MAAFARHDVTTYFESFAPEATFIFHNCDDVVLSRTAYEDLWRTWERDGFRVLSCASIGGAVQMLGADVGVFRHSVRTALADGNGSIETGERETIVFQRLDGRWLGVHEHLSVDPTF